MGSEAFETKLPGLVIFEPAVFGDERSLSMRIRNRRRYEEVVMLSDYLQNKLAYSRCAVFRGLLLQNRNAQGRLVSVPLGEVFDVAVDLRDGSSTFGEWMGPTLFAENQRQSCVPEGFSYGFVATGKVVLFSYKCADYYWAVERFAIRGSPRIGTDWPTGTIKLSAKGATAPRPAEFPAENPPRYAEPNVEPRRVASR